LDGLIFGLCAVLSLLSAAICLRYARERRHKPTYRVARRAHLTALVACFLGSLLAIPTVADAVDHYTAINEVSSLASDVAAVIFCASLQIMIMNWWYSEVLHVGMALRVGTVCVVIALLVWLYHRADTVHVELSTAYARSDEVRQYLLTYLFFVAVAGVEVAVRSMNLARAARRQGRPAAATGLAVAAAGAAFGVAYAVSRGGYLIAYKIGHAWPLALENAISPAFAGLSIGCVAIGLTMTTISPSINPRSAAIKV
jgi:predicted permease